MSAFSFFFFLFFWEVRFYGSNAFPMGHVHCSQDPQTSFFSKNFIKNGSHDTIYIFKNYLVIVFSIFSFYQNKWYPNTPKVFVWQRLFLPTYFTILLIFVTIYGSHCTFWYYLLVLFISPTVLFQLNFTFIYSTFNKKFSILTK